jgi:capsular exopolysaccharide synthesis family protein
VEEAAVEAAHIRERDGIVDPDPESQNSPLQGADRHPYAIELAKNEQQLKVAQLRTMITRTDMMKPEEFQGILHTFNIEDPTFLQSLSELQKSQTDEATLLSSGLGVNHPRIKSLRAKEQALSSIINGALGSIKTAQATKLKVEEETLSSLEKRLEEANAAAIKSKNLSGPYIDAKTKYLEAKRILEAAEMHLSTARMEKGIDIDPVKIWERAEVPLGPSEPPVSKYLFIAAVIGSIVGVGLAFFIEYLDTSVKTLDDVERFLQIAVLAVVPKGVPMLIKIKGDHPDAEAYRILRANIEFNKPSPDAKTVTLISAGPGEGKSTTLNNLAFTCAKGGYNVLVVDADLRRPSQHTYFDTDNAFGLTDYLTGKATIDAVTRTTKIDNLSFIPSGQVPGDAVGILNSQAMTGMIEKVKSHYDLIFFDSPPILGVSDGSVLASEMDMTVMVIQHRRFPRAMLQRVKQAVQQVGGSMIGAVLNNVDSRHDDGYSYYNAYQDYYSAPRRDAARRPAATRRPVATTAATPTRNGDEGGDY